MPTYVLSLSDPRATLEIVGGKGMSLGKLAFAGFSVPDGFHITTDAYRRFVSANDLQAKIIGALQGVDATEPAVAEIASTAIRELFHKAEIPEDIASAIRRAYAELCSRKPDDHRGLAVAVRSSATAEDLPDASFAGQQETYLNIRGAETVVETVRECWASLWTARAIAYRAKQGIAPDSVALAVVVQELVCADAAGVMFTANPINGRRDEIMITATWGLGEAIVSGLVTPDTLTVEKPTGKMIRRETAEKSVMTIRTESGTGKLPVPNSRKKKPVLSDAQARNLAELGADIERLYDMPMDIEWTLAAGKFAIVQARPVTALPSEAATELAPKLEWHLPHPKALMARGSFAEFVPEPVSPLFATLAIPIARRATVKLMGTIGMSDEDSYLMSVINDYLYVGFIFTPKMIWKMLAATLFMFNGLLKTAQPRAEAARAKILTAVDKWQSRELASLSASELLEGAAEIFKTTAQYYTEAQSGTIPGAMLNEVYFSKYYDLVVKGKGDPEAFKFVFGAENHAMRAEKALYDLAMWAKGRPQLESYLVRTPAEEICTTLASDSKPIRELAEFAERFNAYLEEYGHAIYDLDFAKPVPAEAPAPLVEAMKVYLSGSKNPYERQQVALEVREQATKSISGRLDPLRKKYFLKFLKTAQDTAPLRENSIADLGLGYPQIRRLLGELGRRLAARGVIACADDIYWLQMQELEALAAPLQEGGAPLPSFAADVQRRKAQWQAMRTITPPTTLPKVKWMAAFYPKNEGSGATIKGFAASAGRITARACVMLGPEDFGKMQPGDVIVAGITTPAWTPLFARAAGIVTDIGGPLSHSSIVAREYGIPAVLATGNGTRRIKDGQTITVDGSAGTVTLNPS
jgi:phosphoenolpyruvate synthase/pyruvate phosphate dikinase